MNYWTFGMRSIAFFGVITMAADEAVKAFNADTIISTFWIVTAVATLVSAFVIAFRGTDRWIW